MRRFLKWLGIALGILMLGILILMIVVLTSDRGRIRLPVRRTETFEHPALGTFPSPLHVEGNRLVDEAGRPVRLRGLMPIDPAVLHAENRFRRELFEDMAAAGANVVRIGVHPHYWEDDPDYLWRYLDPAVTWAGELGMYVIVDFHSIGNLRTGRAPLMPELYSHTEEMTLDFWMQVAGYFQDTPHVLFELFNEPQGIEADAWRETAAGLVDVVRAQGAGQPVIVGGVEYARSLAWVLEDPVPGENIVYAVHIYPGHSQILWDLYFGQVAASYPVLITEWGFVADDLQTQQEYLEGSVEGYGAPFLDYLDERGIGWVAAWYDDEWEAPMFTPGWDALTRYGEFVLERLEDD